MPGWCVLKWERAAGSLSWMPSLLKPLFVSGRVRCSLCCWAADGFCARFWGKYQKPINYKTYKWLIRGGVASRNRAGEVSPHVPGFARRVSKARASSASRLLQPPGPLLCWLRDVEGRGRGGRRPQSLRRTSTASRTVTRARRLRKCPCSPPRACTSPWPEPPVVLDLW